MPLESLLAKYTLRFACRTYNTLPPNLLLELTKVRISTGRVGITRSQTRYHVGSRTPSGHHKKKNTARQHNGRAKPSLVGHRPEVSGLPPGQRREGDCSLAQIEVAMMGVGPSGDVVKGACGGLRLLRVVRAFSHQQRVNPAGCRHAKRGLADADRAPLPPKKTIFRSRPCIRAIHEWESISTPPPHALKCC